MDIINENEPHPTLTDLISSNGRQDADSFNNSIPQNQKNAIQN